MVAAQLSTVCYQVNSSSSEPSLVRTALVQRRGPSGNVVFNVVYLILISRGALSNEPSLSVAHSHSPHASSFTWLTIPVKHRLYAIQKTSTPVLRAHLRRLADKPIHHRIDIIIRKQLLNPIFRCKQNVRVRSKPHAAYPPF